MLAKFLAVEEAISIAPHSTAEVKLQDADLSNVGFIFPTTETAARWLILANAGLLLWPAKAFVHNSKDVTQNIARGECIAINVKLEEEGLMMGELQAPSASEAAEEAVESDESPEETENTEAPTEVPTESAETDAPVNPDEITDPMEGSDSENDSSEAESETNESSENAETEEPVKKSSRSKK